jgi:hypothetical protein
LDWTAYGPAVKAEIDSLSVPQRLQQFSNYYYATPTDGYFIFQVVGLKGSADFSVGAVNFYSPWRKKYITGRPEGDSEYFGETEDRHFLNAAVKVSYVDTIAAKMSAIEFLEKALDVVRSYLPIKTNLEVRRGTYLVANAEGLRIGLGRSTSTTSETYKWSQSFDFDRDQIEAIHEGDVLRLFDRISQFLFKSPVEQNDIEQKLVYSFHWYRKAIETTIVEDKLLNYWIVIEGLLSFNPSSTNILLPRKERETKYTLARELIPPLRISYFIYDVGFALFWQIRELVADNDLNLPNEIIEACGLNQPISGDLAVTISPFIANLPLLTANIDRKLIKDRCEFTHRFYTEHEFAKEQIEERIKQIKEDILLIYRYRNKIVHNAHFDNIIVPYFVEKAGIYAMELLKRIVYAYTVDEVDSIEEILVTAYVRVKRLLEKLERNIPVDFLNLNF